MQEIVKHPSGEELSEKENCHKHNQTNSQHYKASNWLEATASSKDPPLLHSDWPLEPIAMVNRRSGVTIRCCVWLKNKIMQVVGGALVDDLSQ